ncbi:hypothetical protein ABTK00_21885, partial [Acinetobacter baumannii]
HAQRRGGGHHHRAGHRPSRRLATGAAAVRGLIRCHAGSYAASRQHQGGIKPALMLFKTALMRA